MNENDPARESELDPDEEHELRALYRRLEPPPLADSAEEADPETARVVGWMQTAWRGLAVPPARVPLAPPAALRPKRVARTPRLVRRALVAAAAVLVLAGGAALWRALTREPALAPRAPVAEVTSPASPSARGVEIVASLPGRLELRSGPVHLVLLDPPDSSPNTRPTTPTDVSQPGG